MRNQQQISYHPDRGRLKFYSDGLCDRTESILIEAHLHFCSDCAQKVANWQDRLDAELSLEGSNPDLTDLAKADQQLNSIFQSIDCQDNRTQETSEYGIPSELLQELPALSAWKWLSFWPSKGKVAWLASDISGDYELYLGIIDGAFPTPAHDHRYHEQTLPLLGLYCSMDDTFRPGEWSEVSPGEIHEPSSVDGTRCVCLIRSHKNGFRFVGGSAWRNLLLSIAQLGAKLTRSLKKS